MSTVAALPRQHENFLRGRLALLLVITVSALFAVADLPTGSTSSAQLALVACTATALAAAVMIAASARGDQTPAGLGTLCIAVIGIVGIAIPAQQLIDGERRSVLSFLGVSSPNVVSFAPQACLVYVLCLCSFALVELIPRRLPLRHDPERAASWESPPLYWALLVVGVGSTLALGAGASVDSFASRGQGSGQGIGVILQQCLLVAIACGVANKHWGHRAPAIASAAAMVFSLSFTTSRSGLLFVVVALGVRWLRRIRRQGLGTGTVVGFGVMAYAVAVFIVGFAQWRTQYARTGSADLLYYLGQASLDPVRRLATEGSLDTFDGLVLSLNVDREVVGATVLDPLRGVLNLVPSQLWPNKPGYLAPEITHYYTDFGGQAGIFLSGPGYALIVAGGVVGACLFFAALAAGFTWLFARYYHSPVITTILLYTMLRFIVGGDSFDFQYGLTLVMSTLLGLLVVRGVRTFVPRRGGRAASPLHGSGAAPPGARPAVRA